MARALRLQCPNCGAPLQVNDADTQVVCAYCRHTSVLERPNQPRPQVPVSIDVHTIKLPSLVPKFFGLVMLMVVASVGLAGFVAYQALRGATDQAGDVMSMLPGAKQLIEQATGAGGGAGGFAAPSFQFSDQPQLVDLDGDGHPEIVGLSRQPGGPVWIGAYDGVKLTEIWRTDLLGEDASGPDARRAVVPGYVLSADALGRLQAYHVKTGQPAWATLIGERVREFCFGEGFVRVIAMDKKAHDLAVDTGKRLESAPTGECTPVLGTRSTKGPLTSLIGWSEFDDHGLPSLHGVSGISAHRALVVSGTKRAFLLGSKSEGTGYPLVAAVEGKNVLWMDAVAGMDPMKSESNVTTQLAAYFGGKLAIPYEVRGSSGMRMALFEAASGKRLWDQPIHERSQVETGIVMTEHTIYYASWTAVYVLDVATGKRRGLLGSEF